MIRASLLALPLLLASGIGYAQTASPAAIGDSIIKLERQSWLDWRAHNLAAIRGWTAPDYWTVSESGADQGLGFPDIVRMFDQAALRSFRLDSMVARQISPDVVIVAYNAHLETTFEGKDASRDVAEASVWVRREGRWLNVFLHEVTRPDSTGGSP